MRRRWPLAVFWLALTSCLALTGCGEASPEQQARDDARGKVDAAYGTIAGSPRIWPAEALGRRAIEAGFDLMAIDGVESGSDGPGVAMIVRVSGHGAEHAPLYGTEQNAVDLLFCYRLRFAKVHAVLPAEPLECPASTPVSYPPLQPPPRLPEPEAVKAALTGVPTDTSAVRAALEPLDLDERVYIDVQGGVEAVGVALRSVGPFNQRHACLLIRVAPDGVEAWYLSGAQYQPGELSCTANEAIGRAGIRPPH